MEDTNGNGTVQICGTASFPQIVPRNCLESKELYTTNSNLQFTLQIAVRSD
jgi:hypothetical protein